MGGKNSKNKHAKKNSGIDSPRAQNPDPQPEPVATPPPPSSDQKEETKPASSSSSNNSVQQRQQPAMAITVIGDGDNTVDGDQHKTPEKKSTLAVSVTSPDEATLDGLKSPAVKSQETKQLQDQEHLAVEFPEGYKNSFRRRASVSAEVDLDPNDNKRSRVIEKTTEQREAIRSIVNSPMNFLFAGLDEAQKNQIIDATEIVNVKPGEDVIRQYDGGDNFYIIGSGDYEVYKCFGPQNDPGEEKKVFQYEGKGTFGELSLMYNAPRAATVRAKTAGTLYAMDRTTFRQIIVTSTREKHQLYGEFIDSVPLLENLSSNERVQIVDGLVAHEYKAGETIIEQGQAGESLFVIEQGRVAVTQTEEGETQEKLIRELKEGDFFGELALLEKITRTSSVKALEDTRCLLISREAFERLFGDVRSVMNRRAEKLYSDRRNSLPSQVSEEAADSKTEAPAQAEAAAEPVAEQQEQEPQQQQQEEEAAPAVAEEEEQEPPAEAAE